jgi:beta-glucanase (GH16 family)
LIQSVDDLKNEGSRRRTIDVRAFGRNSVTFELKFSENMKWMGAQMLLIGVLFSAQVAGIDVTFRLNMQGFSGFNTPEVNGTFNNWCGSCNPMSDSDGDGIWETTIDIPPGNIQYKFSFDNWAGQENLSAASGCVTNDGSFSNRTLTVAPGVEPEIVCWGLCTDCIPADNGEWTLSWSDEFNGTELDGSIWTPEFGDHGWGNNELQNYTDSPNNINVSNGRLTITAREEGAGNYTSARIITNNKMEFQYGKIEARIRVPIGQGIWPAFWMLGANFESVGWPHCGEIDIMEHVNNEPLTNSAIHWFNNFGHTYETNSVPFIKNEFRLYGAIWNEDGVTFFLDDAPFFHFDFESSNNSEQIFQKPFFFLLNVAVGGNWPGSPDATTTFPASMEVDYIRVYAPSALSNRQTEPADPVQLFPVPVQDMLNVDMGEGNGVWTISVYDVQGKKLEDHSGNEGIYIINTSKWSASVYFLLIERQGFGVRSYRVVKR